MNADVPGRSTAVACGQGSRFQLFAVAWQTAYALVHLWWVVGGAPRFLMGRESYFPGGWVPVVIAAVALLGCAAVVVGAGRGLSGSGHYVLAGLNAAAGVALCVYSFLFPVIIVSILFEGGGTDKVVSLLATGSGAVGGVFCLVIAASERRLATHPCNSCGRVHGRSPERRDEKSPGWAYAGAYLAVGGFLARMSVWLDDTVAGRWPSAASRANGFSWTAMVVFLALMGLAGTMLPLALAHRWGRLWPAWLGPLSGRPVPRWLVLGVGLFIGASLTAYFGIAGMTAWIRGEFGGPFLPLLLEMVGYTLWGVGLLVASASYFTLTRAPCARGAASREFGRNG
ncbi:hypothetical protein [Plantactinospora soyae]|uniref:Uncharacterized protein n=1 Tax=Plantactinospora soyae TaxID=1544732 RepID=A0A927QYV3_9ACTN|nr:hypothetical protein [Plantactinospora soyae]MBE1488297.1 hypothetical protein [Plantactinospora soyae]